MGIGLRGLRGLRGHTSLLREPLYKLRFEDWEIGGLGLLINWSIPHLSEKRYKRKQFLGSDAVARGKFPEEIIMIWMLTQSERSNFYCS